MTMRLIPHAQAVSEFIAGYHGDCGETAELTFLHVINPAAYPLNATDLSTIVKRDISKGWASSNGSEPISAIAHDLNTLALHYTNYGYAEPFGADWRGQLAQWGGIKPIVFEYAHAGHLPGDESGVSYHFNCCLGWDPATHSGLFADGDNLVERQGGTALVTYSESDLANAGLCGMLVGEYQLGGVQMVIPSGWKYDSATLTLTAPNGKSVTQGFCTEVLNWPGGWEADNQPLEEAVGQAPASMGLGGTRATRQTFAYRMLGWSDTDGVRVIWMGVMFLRGEGDIASLNGQVAQQQAATQAAQGQRDALSAQLATAQSQIASLQQQLAAAQAAATPAPAPLTAQQQNDLAAMVAMRAALA